MSTKTLAAVIVVSFLVLAISFWKRDTLPGSIDDVDAPLGEPLQGPTSRAPFDVSYNDLGYRVEPEFSYDISGVVVSFRHHDGKSRMHRRANDHLNMLDICVIWGDNTQNANLDKMRFYNGIFTCIVKTRDQQAWQSFDMHQLSNNHLISDDEYIRDRVTDVRIGDQVRIRGYLASYSNAEGGRRGTSTTRTDNGNGACETIYVDDFEILRSATSRWRISMWISLIVLVSSLVAYFRRPFRPHAEQD